MAGAKHFFIFCNILKMPVDISTWAEITVIVIFEKQGLRIICPDSLMFAWIVIFLFFKYSRSELR